jgi:CubicO group peptidase (beta-lactamase class C family)
MSLKVHLMAFGRNSLVIMMLVTGCFCWCSCTSSKATKLPVAFAAARTQQLEGLIHYIQEEFPVPGMTVAMVYNDSVYSTALGISNANKSPFTVNTPFLAGSISEPMLATAILKLATEGKIDLDEPVTTYLPYFKMGGNSYKSITIKHLLTHTSGIPHYSIMWDAPNNDANAPEVTTRSIASQLPDFAPGSRVKRSPYNYDILADVISKVTGKPFDEYLKSTVFKGLNMLSSSFVKPAQTAMPFSVSNWLSYTMKQDTLYPYNRENGGSGGFHTTAKDMAGWMYNMLNYNTGNYLGIFHKNVYNQILSTQYKTGKHSAIGFGWDIIEENGEKVYIKGSQYGGFSNQIILIPSKKIGVAVTSNIAGDFNPANLTRTIAMWLSGSHLIEPKIPVSMAMGKEFARTGNIQDAFKLYTVLKYNQPQKYDVNAAALSQFGTNLLHRVNDKQNALKALQFCVAQYPKSAYAYLTLAEGYVFAKDAKNTRIAIDKAKKLRDDSGLKASYLNYLLNNLEILEEKKS